jgi:hypothetical protein
VPAEYTYDYAIIRVVPRVERFHWLVSPRSTIIQMSPPHTGRTSDPRAALERLLDTMVRRPASPPGSR